MKLITLSTLLLALPVSLFSQQHKPWDLAGAQDRIEKHRMGKATLQLQYPEGTPVAAEASYELELTRHAFNFGGSLASEWKVAETGWYPRFKERFARLFNYATMDFYWAVHEKKPGRWSHAAGSLEKLQWAQEQGMRLRGHPLMWHQVLPRWISDQARPVHEIDADIREHVRMLVREYPMIDQWDTYNEGPGIFLQDPSLGVRRWVEALGGPGPATAVVMEEARGVQPNGYFILNHFTDKDPKFDAMLDYYVENEIKFDAIGIQTHIHTKKDMLTEKRLWDALEKYASYGVPLHLSEVSILSCQTFDEWKSLKSWKESVKAAERKGQIPPVKSSTDEWERFQADFAKDLYTLAFSHPAVDAIIWWTITDIQPWRGLPAGLLDGEGRAKPVYEGLDELINKEWHTHLRGSIGAEGVLHLSGFYGTYKITVREKGRTFVGTFELEPNRTGVQSTKLKEIDGL